MAENMYPDLAFTHPVGSHEGRVKRIEILKELIKDKKEMAREELYRFGLSDPRFGISMVILDRYLKQLEILGLIEIGYEKVRWIGGKK